MRALKTLLIILAAVLVLALILGLIGPKDFRIERSTYVKAPASAVYANVSSLGNMNKWGPWKDMEHNMTTSMSGSPDGQVGAISHWKSDESEGEQEIAALEADKHVGLKLRFISPWKAENEASFDLSPAGDSTKVTWGMQGHNDFMARIMCVFMNMDKMVGPMFEQGLANLKKVTETEHAQAAAAQANVFRGFTIETVERPEMVYVGKREVVKWDKMGAFFGKNYPAQGKALGEAKLEMAAAPSGVYFKWDEANKQADVMAAMPVKAGADTKVKGWETFVVPAGKALFIPYHGAYDKSMEAHMAMDEMMKANNLSLRDVVIEEYVTDPMVEKDTTKWLTNIYYMVK